MLFIEKIAKREKTNIKAKENDPPNKLKHMRNRNETPTKEKNRYTHNHSIRPHKIILRTLSGKTITNPERDPHTSLFSEEHYPLWNTLSKIDCSPTHRNFGKQSNNLEEKTLMTSSGPTVHVQAKHQRNQRSIF